MIGDHRGAHAYRQNSLQRAVLLLWVTRVACSACQFTRASRRPLLAATARGSCAAGCAADEAQARGACDRPQTWGTMRWKARACRLLCWLRSRATCFVLGAHAVSAARRLRLRVLGRRARGGGCGHREPVLQRQRRAAPSLLRPALAGKRTRFPRGFGALGASAQGVLPAPARASSRALYHPCLLQLPATPVLARLRRVA